MKELMDQVCKFKVGDKVALVGQVEVARMSDEIQLSDQRDRGVEKPKVMRGIKGAPQLLIVTERIATECYSNVQVAYVCSLHSSGPLEMGSIIKHGPISEPELVEYPA